MLYLITSYSVVCFCVSPDDICGEEDHEDSEYNFMAEDQKEEKEEYRNDRAVRIPRKLSICLLFTCTLFLRQFITLKNERDWKIVQPTGFI